MSALEKIHLWRDYHDPEIFALIDRAWKGDECLIFCPPRISDLSFVERLKNSQTQFTEKPVLGVFTTGTSSGKPRLVLYSKKNIQSSLNAVKNLFDPNDLKSVFCYPQPLHTFGLNLGYMFSYLFGLKFFAADGKYSRDAHAMRLSLDEPGLLTLGTPTHFLDLLSYVEKEKAKVSQTYAAIVGGAAVAPQLWHRLRKDLKILNPSIGYGATEASPAVTHLPPGIAPQEFGEIGRALPHLQVKIRDEGLEFEGDSVCLAIVSDEKIEFPKSILLSDKVISRSDGRLVYQGRLDFVLNRGGEKFSLEQIELALKENFDANFACIGVVDSRLGEELGVLVESTNALLSERIDEIYDFLEEKFGVAFARDKIVGVAELPHLENLKLDRKACLKILLSSQPISVTKLYDYLPHRPPMVWIDDVLWSNEFEGECRVSLKADALYFKNGIVKQSAPVEWMAQACGYIEATRAIKSGGTPLKRAFLVSLKNVDFAGTNDLQEVQPGMNLRISVKTLAQVGPFSVVDGRVTEEVSGRHLGSAQLKLYGER